MAAPPPPKLAAAVGTWTDYLGYGLGAVVFLGMGLMRGLNEPTTQIPLAPGLHVVAAAPKGEKVRLLAKVVSVEGATVQLEDGPNKAKASVRGDAALRLVPGTYAILSCDVAEPGANLTLDCG
ncbi:MAG: hypothetical protein IPM79_21230 [Polyangiaceae bacterium]|nr:hypothetical protein [Polyangiaceae bacterium]